MTVPTQAQADARVSEIRARGAAMNRPAMAERLITTTTMTPAEATTAMAAVPEEPDQLARVLASTGRAAPSTRAVDDEPGTSGWGRQPTAEETAAAERQRQADEARAKTILGHYRAEAGGA